MASEGARYKYTLGQRNSKLAYIGGRSNSNRRTMISVGDLLYIVRTILRTNDILFPFSNGS